MKIILSDKQNVFFCSDPHYNQDNIVLGISKWPHKDESCRPFNTLEEHNKAIVDNINSRVGKNDILFVLGDWSFGSYGSEQKASIWDFRKQLNCENIHLILGNHDDLIRDNIPLPNCWRRCRPPFEYVDTINSTSDYDEQANAQDIFTSVQQYKEIYIIEQSKEQGVKATKTLVCMSHYPMRSWRNQKRGSIMLHGHCHNNLPDMVVDGNKVKTMDVGFDTRGDLVPYSWDEIKLIMSTRKTLTPDER